MSEINPPKPHTPVVRVSKQELETTRVLLADLSQRNQLLTHTLAAIVLLNGGKVTLTKKEIERASLRVLNMEVLENERVVWRVKPKEDAEKVATNDNGS